MGGATPKAPYDKSATVCHLVEQCWKCEWNSQERLLAAILYAPKGVEKALECDMKRANDQGVEWKVG